jgi:creatinine deaminase
MSNRQDCRGKVAKTECDDSGRLGLWQPSDRSSGLTTSYSQILWKHKTKFGPPTKMDSSMDRDLFLQAAVDEAKLSLSAGGIPIGSVLVSAGKIIGRGHNCRVQTGSAIDHGEMNCLRNAGRLPSSVYKSSTIYSTLSPCPMCSGAIVLYKIPHVIVGENINFLGAEEYMRSQGVRVDVVQDAECIQLMKKFIAENPRLWNEDIGV